VPEWRAFHTLVDVIRAVTHDQLTLRHPWLSCSASVCPARAPPLPDPCECGVSQSVAFRSANSMTQSVGFDRKWQRVLHSARAQQLVFLGQSRHPPSRVATGGASTPFGRRKLRRPSSLSVRDRSRSIVVDVTAPMPAVRRAVRSETEGQIRLRFVTSKWIVHLTIRCPARHPELAGCRERDVLGDEAHRGQPALCPAVTQPEETSSGNRQARRVAGCHRIACQVLLDNRLLLDFVTGQKLSSIAR
jgi:hypothetical protein